MFFFFFNDTATPEIYSLSLPDALPISKLLGCVHDELSVEAEDFFRIAQLEEDRPAVDVLDRMQDRKSTRLNSSHSQISYAVFCLKKKNNSTQKLPPVHAIDQALNLTDP